MFYFQLFIALQDKQMSLLEMKRNLNFIYEHSHANLTDVTIICLISSLISPFILLVHSGPQLINTWNGHSFYLQLYTED